MVLSPVPMAAQAHASSSPLTNDSEPPSTRPIDGSLLSPQLEDITFATQLSKEGLLVAPPTPDLASVEVGKSQDTTDQEIAAQKAQAEAEAQRQEQEKQRALAAQQAKAKARLLAAVPVSAPSFTGNVPDLVHEMTAAAFGEDQWPAMAAIISRESGFNPNSYNKRSGACGLFQANPCFKMGGMEVSNQIRWGIGYIRARYGTPSRAWAFWLSHHWY